MPDSADIQGIHASASAVAAEIISRARPPIPCPEAFEDLGRRLPRSLLDLVVDCLDALKPWDGTDAIQALGLLRGAEGDAALSLLEERFSVSPDAYVRYAAICGFSGFLHFDGVPAAQAARAREGLRRMVAEDPDPRMREVAADIVPDEPLRA